MDKTTVDNLFGYATRFFQERGGVMKSDSIRITSVTITVHGTIFHFDEDSTGHTYHRIAGFDHDGHCKFNMLL